MVNAQDIETILSNSQALLGITERFHDYKRVAKEVHQKIDSLKKVEEIQELVYEVFIDVYGGIINGKSGDRYNEVCGVMQEEVVFAEETLECQRSPPVYPEITAEIIGRKEDYIIVAEKIAALYGRK